MLTAPPHSPCPCPWNWASRPWGAVPGRTTAGAPKGPLSVVLCVVLSVIVGSTVRAAIGRGAPPFPRVRPPRAKAPLLRGEGRPGGAGVGVPGVCRWKVALVLVLVLYCTVLLRAWLLSPPIVLLV